ncbi:site-specific DNA-methyltransferase [Blastomonas fulva]|uniref:site-specific DNA-methyltransferase (adenine-specific) n=1 Tax=Blastomonas fulva TaxID=1550728 RepID=A0ABN5BAA7_9SPHN|nr:site-specific DNA-methyltransferase [Blastomonas fulva]ASR53806.1 site-specific DNA-methyltransferase [Blastomonas fulva]
MSKFDELVTKLREIFQIDRPELDFGVYRILNARADEINEYLTKRLREQVEAALATGSAANMEAQQRELEEAIKAAKALGADPETLPKVKELRAAIAGAASGASDHENAVFSHLLAFFSRYYDKGDFISQRRYKGDTYAIPYAGEEVVLHWANKDQYYTKSGEAFSNYGFKLPDGRAVRFQLIAADTAKDNRKDNDKDRRFALAEARTVTRVDDEGEPYEEEIVPIGEEDGDLVIRFEYRAFPAKTKQESLVDAAVQAVLADEAVKASWLDLTTRAPTDKNPQRTVLEKHLTTYTQKNTVDYFIHKDLGTFLRRELDFYIKNEVMNLDDVQDAKSFAAIEANLRMIQCLRKIAQDLITFLASIEDFQKKLWLKKKFVVAAHYCVTLDRVPEALYDRIAANPAQWAQWHDLGMRDSAALGTAADLKAQPYLMVDTALFDATFRADLLKAIPDLDACTDGLLVHGDNFQALALLDERYREKVKSVYIDPPYNTGDDGFAYKDSYRHSSWMTMIANRIPLMKSVMKSNGIFSVSIDRDENRNLLPLLFSEFGEGNFLEEVVWKKAYGGGAKTKHINNLHEYIHQFAIDKGAVPFLDLPPDPDAVKYYKLKDGKFEVRGKHRLQPLNTNSNDFRKSLTYPIPVPPISTLGSKGWSDEAKRIAGCLDRNEIQLTGSFEEGWLLANEDGSPWQGEFVKPERQWQWSWDKVRQALIDDEIVITLSDGVPIASYKQYRFNEAGEERGRKPASVLIGPYTQSGTDAVRSLFGFDAAKFPKPVGLIQDIIGIGYKDRSALVADFFAGSGTTGEATFTLNRSDGGSRRYILSDQGASFDTVLKPRMQKVTYSAEWVDGKPTAPNTGISHAFKVLKIESYEDTLNNLTLKRDAAQQGLLERMGEGARDEYLMRYMLDVEARGSLLSVEDFKKPFDYELDIAVDSAGATQRTKVDLVETFNYLIGLTVKEYDSDIRRGYVRVTGTLPDGKLALIIWRDCEVIDHDRLQRLIPRFDLDLAERSSKYEVIYINGDHNIPLIYSGAEGDGVVERTLKLRQIEPEFLSRMFDVADA